MVLCWIAVDPVESLATHLTLLHTRSGAYKIVLANVQQGVLLTCHVGDLYSSWPA